MHVHFIVPGDINTLTGGYIYDRRIIEELPGQGISVRLHALDSDFPFPSPSGLVCAASEIDQIVDGSTVIIDGLALAPLHEVLQRHVQRLRLVGLVHHPLSEETGLTCDVAGLLESQEREALSYCKKVIVTSETTLRSLVSDYNVVEDRVSVIEPGLELVRTIIGSPIKNSLKLICVGTLVPRKGHKILIEALSFLSDRRWNLTCIGDLDRDKRSATQIMNLSRKRGLSHRVKFVGTVDEATLIEHYRRAHVFVLASHHEGYGMALAEALSHGLPVISTTAGAIPHTVPKSASLLVPPGNVRALTASLARVLDDPRCRNRLVAGARGSKWRQRSWQMTIHTFALEIKQLINDG